jgi:hypothetical protein
VWGRSSLLAQSCHDHQRDCNVRACTAPKVFGLAEEAGRGFVTLRGTPHLRAERTVTLGCRIRVLEFDSKLPGLAVEGFFDSS